MRLHDAANDVTNPANEFADIHGLPREAVSMSVPGENSAIIVSLPDGILWQGKDWLGPTYWRDYRVEYRILRKA